eukprot:7389118-Prymnesium_polylepis.1
MYGVPRPRTSVVHCLYHVNGWQTTVWQRQKVGFGCGLQKKHLSLCSLRHPLHRNISAGATGGHGLGRTRLGAVGRRARHETRHTHFTPHPFPATYSRLAVHAPTWPKGRMNLSPRVILAVVPRTVRFP